MILRLNERQFINTEQITLVNVEKSATTDIYRVHFAGGFSHSWRPDSPEAKAIQNWIDRNLGDGMFEYGFILPDKTSVRGNHLETLMAERDMFVQRFGAENVGEIVARRKILPLDVEAAARKRARSRPIWKHEVAEVQ